MKVGCIFKLFAIIIVILGTSFYLYDKYGKDFLTESTERAKEIAIKKIEKMVDDFTKKEIQNPLKDKFAELLEDVEKRKDDYTDANFDKIISKFNEVINDNNLNETSLKDLKKMVESKK